MSQNEELGDISICDYSYTYTNMPKAIVKKTSVTPEAILFDLLAYTNPNNGCSEWRGACATDGYPVQFGNRKVHRTVASIKYERDITGLVVRHTCDNPKCINPEHLILGTPMDNIKDRDERNRTYRVITKEKVEKVKALLDTKLFLHKEIAALAGIDVRRVSDINRNLYSPDGKFLGRKER